MACMDGAGRRAGPVIHFSNPVYWAVLNAAWSVEPSQHLGRISPCLAQACFELLDLCIADADGFQIALSTAVLLLKC